MRYETTLRNKWISMHAKSPKDMIAVYQDQLNLWTQIQKDLAAGKIKVDFGGAAEDYITVSAPGSDPNIAEQYDMQQVDEEYGDEFDDQ